MTRGILRLCNYRKIQVHTQRGFSSEYTCFFRLLLCFCLSNFHTNMPLWFASNIELISWSQWFIVVDFFRFVLVICEWIGSTAVLEKNAKASEAIAGIPYKNLKIGVGKEKWTNEKRFVWDHGLIKTMAKLIFIQLRENLQLLPWNVLLLSMFFSRV